METSDEITTTQKMDLLMQQTRRQVLVHFLFPSSPAMVGYQMHMHPTRIWRHVKLLHVSGLLEKLPRERSLVNKKCMSKTVKYVITAEGRRVLDMVGELAKPPAPDALNELERI